MPAALAILGVLLTAMVGLASAGSPWAESDGGGALPAPVAHALVVALAGGLCAFVVLAWVNATPRTRKRKRAARGALVTAELGGSVRTGARALLTGLAVVLLIVAFAIVLARPSGSTGPVVPGAKTHTDVAATTPPRPGSPAATTFRWFTAALAASLAILVPLGFLARRRLREAVTEASEPGAQDAVARAVVDSIGDIERDPDARRSIIRAYARMEAAFDDTGIPRRPHEAPFEFVGRALGGVHVTPSVAERLATLFERARFSTHPIRVEEKGEALGALREIQRELEPEP